MKTTKAISVFAILILSVMPLKAQDTGIYATAMIGYSIQASDVTPFGQNLAVDPSFPDAFSGGSGVTGGFGIGFQYDNFRVEGRFGRRTHEIDETKDGLAERSDVDFMVDGDFKAQTFTLEGFFDVTNASPLTPYVKAGLGFANTKYSTRLGGNGVADFDPFDGTVDGFYDAYEDGSESGLAWLAGLGASFTATDRASLFAEYQYVSLGSIATDPDDFTDGFEIENAGANEILLGLRFRF